VKTGSWLRWGVWLLAAAPGCAGGIPSPLSEPAPGERGARAPEVLPVGLGSLRQDDITLTLRDGPVQIKVTPLEASVTVLTAPDTWERLSGLEQAHRLPLTTRAGPGNITLFLVSFFSDQAGQEFHPLDLSLTSSGLSHRPRAIHPITPGWDRERLEQRDTQMAVYAYATRVDFDQAFTFDYRMGVPADWGRVLPLLQRERARIRARGGPPGVLPDPD
jgi:hypothetical protein